MADAPAPPPAGGDPPAPQPLPDLVVLHVGSSPANPVAGDDVVFDVTVLNQGDGPAGPFHVGIDVGGTYNADEPVDGLGPGESVNVSFDDAPFSTSPQAGQYWVVAKADDRNEVDESNELNNYDEWLMVTQTAAEAAMRKRKHPCP